MADNDEDQEPTLGEIRMIDIRRDGVVSVEIEIFNGTKWISFQDILDGKITEGKGDQ